MKIAARAGAVVCFFAGLFFLSQAYTLAFHGLYLDCLHSGCAPRHYDEPSLNAVLYGTVLAAGALVTFYAGLATLRSSRR